MPEIGKPSIIITPPTTGGGGGTTPIEIDGALYTFNGTITNGIAIQVNLVDSGGNLVPNVGVTQVGNVFAAEIIDFTPIEVNGVSVGDVDNWILIEVETFDKNGNPISAVSTLTGNVLELDIAGQTALTVNANASGYVTNWDTIDIDIDDKNGNMLVEGTSFTKSIVGNNISFDISGTTPLQVNGGASIGVIPNWDLADILLRDQSANVVPLVSSSISGSQVTLNINNYPAPSGVAFKVAPCTQRTSFDTWDEGWRYQNGWWDYVPPTYPAKTAELDYSIASTGFWYTLKQSLRVGSVLSTTRFVDVDGGQTWASVNNKQLVVVDKLTGLMFTRVADQPNRPYGAGAGQALTQADAYSIVVAGNTYNDWYIPTLEEFALLFGTFRNSGAWIDPNTSATIAPTGWANGAYWTSTTWQVVANAACTARFDSGGFSAYGGLQATKYSGSLPMFYIRKCRDIIFAS